MSRRGEHLARWALLCALVWAVLAMHHVGSPDTEHGSASHAMTASAAAHAAPAPTSSDEAPPPRGMHDLLHLCMAVVCAIGIALALRLLRRIGAWTPGLRPVTGHRAVPKPARPPPWSGRDVLRSTCVLRL